MGDETVHVHPSAFVDEGAEIGTGTRIWHHVHVRAGSRIGSGCVLGKNVYVDAGVVIGNRCKIQNNVNVYQGVSLADDVFVGPSATFTNDLTPRAYSEDWEIVPTDVGRGASIGAHATIVCGVTLGGHSMVAAGATVTRDVAPHQLVVGTPARPAGWVCRCGRVASREIAPPDSFDCPTCRGEEHQE